MNMKIRANAFAAFGALVNYGIGALHDPFVEQVFLSSILQLENNHCLGSYMIIICVHFCLRRNNYGLKDCCLNSYSSFGLHIFSFFEN